MTPDEQKRIQKWHDTLQSAYMIEDWEDVKETLVELMKDMQAAVK